MDDPLSVKPGEKIIVIGRDNDVLYSDFEPSNPKSKGTHLPDLIDKKNVDILKIIADAIERPGAFAEGNVIFRSEPKWLRVMHQPDYRTHIIFSPPEHKQKEQWKIQKPPR